MIHNYYFDKLQQMAGDFDRKGMKDTARTLQGAAFAIREMALDIEASNRLLSGMGIVPGPNFPEKRRDQ